MIKIIGIAFIGILCYKLIASVKPDIAPLLLIGIGAVLLILLSDSIAKVIATFSGLSEKAGVGQTIFSSLLKIIGIGYLTEYSTNLCEDSGCSSIGKKVEFAGKIFIFIMAIPIITGIIDAIGEIL